MRNHTCLLDHHLRSLYVKIGQKNWVQVVRQPEGEVVRQEHYSKQPNQLQFQFVIDQGDLIKCKMKKTSNSQEISVNSFDEELSSSEIPGRPVEKWDQARSSEVSKSLNVEQTHDRTGRPVANTAAVQDDSQVYLEAGTLNIDDETLRERIEADMDYYHIPL